MIDENVVIGDNCIIEPYAVITGYTEIGDNNHIFSHAVVGSIPQDLKYHGEKTKLIIGNNNKIREFTLINPGTEGGGGVTKIGDNNLLMGYVHIAHDVIIGNNCILANAATLAGHVELEDYVVIGGMTPIHQFVKIGEHAMVGGASAVAQDIPPYCLAEGNRAKLRGLNLTGLRRRFSDRKIIDEIKRAYKELFESGKPLKEVASELVKSENPYVRHLAEFVLNSKRGIPYVRKV
ncbi:acyl-ACP--UDP-N-acetylglucosamine O-acyltransferase [Caminibacter sp.]